MIGIRRPTHSKPGHVTRVRPRLAVRLDPVVHDLEARAVEALDLLEVACEPARDGDVRVRETGNRAIAECEAAVLPELVEAVLRRNADRDAGQRTGELAVNVGVHEVRVQDPGSRACEITRNAEEGDRVDVGGERDRVERDAAGAQLAREVPRARLVLVQHQEAHVPAALLQLREEGEQMRLRARDACDLLQMDDLHAAARMPSAHVSTEWLRATRSRSVLPISARSSAVSPANQRSRSARLSGDSRSKKSG